MICLAVSIGTAKPMPTLPWLPLPPVAIWELMPITFPVASMSGPPEFPGLIGASVCSTSSISKLLGAWIVRWTAEMTPVVRVRSRPKGLPMAMAGSPTCTPLEEPRVSGVRWAPAGSTWSSAMSVDSSLPSTFASTLCLFWNWTLTLVAPLTTWALVRMVPALSRTKPEPVASPCCSWGRPKSNGDCVRWTTCERTKTTPGASRL